MESVGQRVIGSVPSSLTVRISRGRSWRPMEVIGVKESDCLQRRGRNRGRARHGTALAGLVALASLVFVSSATAFHIPAATYNGTHAAGGTVSFTLTADGSGLTNFNVGGPVP